MLEDNGKGMKSGKEKQGIGLLNIASRIDTVNGEINYKPGPDAGTVATIRIPLENLKKGEL
jgi:signal transduction histidine kinase